MKACRLARCVLAALAVLSVAAGAAAQSNTGQISGTIKDASGGLLPGVTVTVLNVNTAIPRVVVTDDEGAYIVTNLPVASYSVAAELQGFRKAEKRRLDMAPDGTPSAQLTAVPGALPE